MIDFKKITLEDLAGYISEQLKKNGVETILVGGACVTIYSKNRYQSYDLDFVTYEDIKIIRKILFKLDFTEKNGYFIHENCPWFIEFVSPPVAIGSEPVSKFHSKKFSLGTVRMLRPEDSVKDRLASFYYWNDRQGLEQALNICLECRINYGEIEKWSKKEGHLEKYKKFFEKLYIPEKNS